MTARSKFDGRVTVYAYGCPSWARLGAAADEQFRLAHDLRNRLVEIEHAHQSAVEAAWSEHADVATWERALMEADAAVDAAYENVKAYKQKERSATVPKHLTEALKAVRDVRKIAKAGHKESKARAYDQLAPVFHELNDTKRAATKGTYAEFVQTRGLYWPTYNAVVDTHTTAVQRVVSDRKSGRPAEMRFHRWTGEGTLTVQLQRAAGDPDRSAATLSAYPDTRTDKWRNVAQLPTRVPGKKWPVGPLRIRIGSKDDAPVWCDVPIVWHRDLPPNADVTQIQITRKKIATAWRTTVAITLRMPMPERKYGGTIGIDIGWRKMPDGGIRVATFVADGPLPDIDGLPAKWIRCNRERTAGTVVIPISDIETAVKHHDIRSIRDKALDVIRGKLVAALDADCTTTLRDACGIREDDKPALWRSPARMVNTMRSLQTWVDGLEPGLTPSIGDLTLLENMRAWWKQDRHLWSWEAHGNDQLLAKRRNVYRVFAVNVARTFAMVRVHDTPLARLAMVPDAAEEDSYFMKLARAQRQMAAPSVLVGCIKNATLREGGEFVSVSIGSEHMHHVCNSPLLGDAIENITLRCPACKIDVDQDVNMATRVMHAENLISV